MELNSTTANFIHLNQRTKKTPTKLVFFFFPWNSRKLDLTVGWKRTSCVFETHLENLLWRQQVLFWHTPRYQQMETHSQQAHARTQSCRVTRRQNSMHSCMVTPMMQWNTHIHEQVSPTSPPAAQSWSTFAFSIYLKPKSGNTKPLRCWLIWSFK